MNRNIITEEQIRYRAYELYVERGRQPGFDCDDWWAAERQLLDCGNHNFAFKPALVASRPSKGRSLVCFIREATFSC